ncbi:MAG: glycosyltransferase family 39 protein [Candidatus Omnitrophica bacterium]|nr:glycosyltransferase family 39 protein [Candidatus Omnitrophota bacterium]
MAKKNNGYIIILFLICLFHIVNNIIILKQDTVPLFFDEGGFYNLSILYYRHLFSSLKIANIFHHFHSISTFYPPLAFIAKMPFFAIWGISQDTSVLANSSFFFLLIYFTFLMGKYFGDAKSGLLAAFLLSFYPGVFGFSRTNFLTIPMAAAVAMSLYFLIRTEAFRSRKFSILFGFSIAFGLLIKWLYLIYLIPALLLFVFEVFSKRKENNFGAISKNFLIALTFGTILILPWYLPNIKNLIPMVLSGTYDNPNWEYFKSFVMKNPFRLGFLKQALMIEQYQLFTYYSVLFIYFLLKYIILKKNDLKKLMFLVSLSIPYLIFNFAITEYYSGDLCPRYTVPLFIIVATITAEGIMEIKKKITRKIIIVSVVLIGIGQFYWTWISYGREGGRYVFNRETFQRYTSRGLLSPKQIDWKISEIIDAIRDNRISNKINVLIIPHTPMTSALDYKLQLVSQGSVFFPLNATFIGSEYGFIPITKYKEAISKSDFVLTQEGDAFSYDDDSAWIRESIDALTTAFEEQKSSFSLLKEVDIYGGRLKILIYRRSIPADSAKDLSGSQGEGILIHAVDFYEGNLVYNSEFGLLIDGGVSPAYAVYEITLPYDGKYELWAKYATRDFRPVEIYFDGTLRKAAALTKFTQGWTYSDSRWFKELDIDAEKGKHTLKFVAQKTPFPHIDSIQIVYKTK